ncbi:MAG: hypothetical protein IT308_10475 [Anaerolineaceae bacterium]|nr:hypothetical protein [Anaerolineaceae bacterium]
MKVVTNEKLINKNKKIGQYTSIASLIILAIGLFASFNVQYINWSFVALIAGFILSQVGIYFGNRWGRSPRPDEKLTQALKGIGDKYTLYHYTTKVSHLLVGPAGIWTLIPYHQGGTIVYDVKNERFKQKGGNIYLKIFAQESLGRPESEIKSVLQDATSYLSEKVSGQNLPPVQPILVFTNPKAVLKCDEALVPALPIEKLKEFIRKRAKEQPISLEIAQSIQKQLPHEN